MRQLAKYAFANAKIRAMRSYLIGPEVFNALLDAADIYECADILKKTPYREIFDRDKSVSDFEKDLLKFDLGIYSKVESALQAPGERGFVGLLRERYELERLKTVIRVWHNKLPVDLQARFSGPAIATEIDYGKLASAAHIEEFIILLDHTPYKKPLMAAREIYKQRNSSFYLEAALDVDYYQRLMERLEKLSSVDRSVARKILGIEVDIENINWLIRLRKYYSLGIGEMLEWFIPGGAWINKETVRKYYTTDGLTKVVESVSLGPYSKIKELAQDNVLLIENFLYGILLSEVDSALSGFPFTIGTVLGYLVLKQKETRNIIAIFQAKEYGWNKDRITPVVRL